VDPVAVVEVVIEALAWTRWWTGRRSVRHQGGHKGGVITWRGPGGGQGGG
jgi:hypothetical protein